ncbi:hypothetical protein LEP1GSC067_0208 [Leptospira interrogans serovar Lora str. TE 1992]|uniref:Uncharacterized protein n=1 Tax=Leptospira interrogans serovar Lora str. TE 1992 TaxID=1193028 RepID=M3EAV7_LEPIR|nr:hypothetical protein LEP1GSC067_0208 [Leptospira interrogans serovar Lora str. TE 1992]
MKQDSQSENESIVRDLSVSEDQRNVKFFSDLQTPIPKHLPFLWT